jgi:TPR repeat protein
MFRSVSDASLAPPLPPAAAAADQPEAVVSEGAGALVADVLQQAHAARMSGDWMSARSLYEQAAPLDGKGEAEAWLSISCITGLGCDKDAHLAHQFALASAEKGFAFGVNNLGHCLEHGIGCAKDVAQAVLMYEKAAAAGEPLAMNNLGLCLQAGCGVEKNEERAAQLFERSARMGSSHGLNSLGNCYFQGRGVQQNYEQAFVLYERASQNRNMNKSAIYNLGCCFYSGKGTPQDLNEAFLQFQRAADLGLDIAQYVAPFPVFVFVTVCAGTASVSACATASAASATSPSPWTASARLQGRAWPRPTLRCLTS